MAQRPVSEHIVDIDVTAEMEASFLEYAYSVIYSRALPDARDGLKPVQRRILYQMTLMGLRPERGYVKSARVVGEVMGKLHPHGDAAIYDTMVRMAQPFSLRLPTIDGHGNFGSLDDGPAAPRYTEARLAPAAMAMTAGLNEDVVDMVPNYDNKLTQPEVLPAAIPHLLVNGATGIAVGMATNMPPHNLIEVIAAARHLVLHPQATLAEIMRFIPGPDLPQGGKIVGLEGIREAYASGRGSFRTRALARIEHTSARKRSIVITELPYFVGPERVIERIKDAVSSRKLQGISAVVDLTDSDHGLCLRIDIKSGFAPEAVLELLYRYTPLEDSFAINNVALVAGQPKTLGLLEMLQVWVDHRLHVIRRRTEHRLRTSQDRLHLVAGLLIAILDIDEVIQVIRSCDDAATARTRLMSIFDLSEAQADYILELRLRRLTRFSRIDLERERDELVQTISQLEAILSSEQQLRNVVADEMTQVAAEHGTPRRTILLEGSTQVTATRGPATLEVADEPCTVVWSATGLVARTAPTVTFTATSRLPHDVITGLVTTTTRAQLGAVTSTGRLLRLDVVDLPAIPPTEGISLAGGVVLAELVPTSPGESIVGLVDLALNSPPISLVTAHGTVKRVVREELPAKEGLPLITLKDNDEVVAAFEAGDEDELVFITSDAQLLRFGAKAVRTQGRPAGGMAGIRTDAAVIWAGAISPSSADESVLVSIAGASGQLPGTQAGQVKVTPILAYPAKGRGTAGVRCHRFARGADSLLTAWVGTGPAKATGAGGQAIALPAPDPRRDGSGTPCNRPIHGVGR